MLNDQMLGVLAVAMVEAGAGISIIDAYSANIRREQGARIAYKPFEPVIEMDIQVIHSTNPKTPDLIRTVTRDLL